MGGRGGLGRGQRRVSPPSLGLARYSGLPGQGQEETLADWFLERAAHSAPVSPADRHMCSGPRSQFASPCVITPRPGRCRVAVSCKRLRPKIRCFTGSGGRQHRAVPGQSFLLSRSHQPNLGLPAKLGVG